MRHLPNGITLLRLAGAVLLAFLTPLSPGFYVVYLFCGISDIADGAIARRLGITSKGGAVLDSIADFLFIAVVIDRLFPILLSHKAILQWTFIIALLRILSLLVGFLRFHTIAFLHTYLNTATGLLLFLFVPMHSLIGFSPAAVLVCLLATVSAMEELLLNITSPMLNRNVAGLFFKCSGE